ncbi:DUF6892 domain-containing protein [Pseudoduganella sp. R-34]|uniref:DUF6892 domain-containing protein n=1 Tax=unclassified Pseudoduganella TaxID=2637179 RepID=UPI003CF11494
MINKDLMYALQTRSKQMIRVLDDFVQELKSYSPEEGWSVVAETIKLVKEISPTEGKYGHLVKAVNRAWLAFGETSPVAANRLYDDIIGRLEGIDWTKAGDAQVGYQLVFSFHKNHLRFPGTNNCLHIALWQHSPRILALIRKIAAYSTEKLFTSPVKPGTGTGADAIEMLLEIYFYHGGLGQSEELRAEAAELILPLVRANPDIGNNITLSLLEHCAERATILSQLINHYLFAGVHEKHEGMFFDIMLALLDNDGGSFIYDDLDKIAAQLEVSSRQWNASQFDIFADHAFFYRLDSDEDRRLLLTKSKKAKRLAKMIVDSGHSGEYIDELRSLYQLIGLPESGKAPANAASQLFSDLNFKLLVIQELMYVQGKLLPKFEVEEFVRRYTDREIQVKKEGYEVIPEVLAHFKELPIPPSLLAQVEKLDFDGGNEIYRQVFPYWDGECDTFDVISPEDVKLVPNLKRMSSMPTVFVARHDAELNKKSIEVS